MLSGRHISQRPLRFNTLPVMMVAQSILSWLFLALAVVGSSSAGQGFRKLKSKSGKTDFQAGARSSTWASWGAAQEPAPVPAAWSPSVWSPAPTASPAPPAPPPPAVPTSAPNAAPCTDSTPENIQTILGGSLEVLSADTPVCVEYSEGIVRQNDLGYWQYGIVQPKCGGTTALALWKDGSHPVATIPSSRLCIALVDHHSSISIIGSAYTNASDDTLVGDYHLLCPPGTGGDESKLPRLKLDPHPEDDELILKFKRGPDGPSNENSLFTINKDGNKNTNDACTWFFTPTGENAEASFEIDFDSQTFYPWRN